MKTETFMEIFNDIDGEFIEKAHAPREKGKILSPKKCGSSFQSSRLTCVIFCLRIFYEIVNSHFVAIFVYNFALAHCFLLSFATVGKSGGMRNVRNLKGICGQVALLLVILNLIQDL